jgi:hypothetical protein
MPRTEPGHPPDVRIDSIKSTPPSFSSRFNRLLQHSQEARAESLPRREPHAGRYILRIKGRARTGDVLDALFSFEEPFDAERLARPIAIRSAAVGEENRDLVERFRQARPEIPHHRG